MSSRGWNRNRIVPLIVALAVLLLIGMYVVFATNRAKADAAARLETAKVELATLQNDAGQLDALRKERLDIRRVLAFLEPGLAPDRKSTFFPTLVAQLQRLADQHRLALENITPTASKAAPASAAPPDGQTATPPAEETVHFSLNMKGTFPDFMAFLKALKTFPKIIEVETIKLTPQIEADDPAGMSPLLGVSMEMNATMLPLATGTTEL